MIRKGTWIVLAVFVVLLGAAFYLNRNPLPKAEDASLTPSATAPSALLNGWQASDITYIAIKGSAAELSLTHRVDGGWDIAPDNTRPVDAGKVENLRSQLAAMLVATPLDASLDPEALGLSNPTNVITLKNAQGQQAVLKIGQPTPTGSGYYVQLNATPPVVVNKSTLDGILGMLVRDQLVATTPTPPAGDTAPAGEATAEPSATKAP